MMQNRLSVSIMQWLTRQMQSLLAANGPDADVAALKEADAAGVKIVRRRQPITKAYRHLPDTLVKSGGGKKMLEAH